MNSPLPLRLHFPVFESNYFGITVVVQVNHAPFDHPLLASKSSVGSLDSRCHCWTKQVPHRLCCPTIFFWVPVLICLMSSSANVAVILPHKHLPTISVCEETRMFAFPPVTRASCWWRMVRMRRRLYSQCQRREIHASQQCRATHSYTRLRGLEAAPLPFIPHLCYHDPGFLRSSIAIILSHTNSPVTKSHDIS